MPNFAPLMKISSCKSYGARIILHGKDIQEVYKKLNLSIYLYILFKAKTHAYELSKTNGYKYINGFGEFNFAYRKVRVMYLKINFFR